MGRLLAATVAALVLCSCSGGGDDTAARPADATTTTTTTADAAPSTTAAPDGTTTVPAGADSCDNRPSGSSPAAFDPASGTYAAHLRSYNRGTSELTFDVVRWLSGQDAVEAFHREHPEEQDGPPNDYYVTDVPGGELTATVEEDAAIWLSSLAVTGTPGIERWTIEDISGHLAEGSDTDVYWLTFSDGKVTEICEQYRP